MTEFGAVHDGERASGSPIMSSAQRVCRKCGSKVFADAPEGLCTACLFETGLDLFANPSVPAGDDSGCSETLNASDSNAGLHSKKKSDKAKRLANFSDYELLEEIGRGGPEVVFRAPQENFNPPGAF